MYILKKKSYSMLSRIFM